MASSVYLMKVTYIFCTSTLRSVIVIFIGDDSGLVNFMEFVCAIWNFLTLPEEDMGSLAFLIKDPSGEKHITCKYIQFV